MTLPYDSSQLGDFLDCPERYRLRYVEKQRKLQEDVYGQPKKFGEALHRGRAAYYAGYSPQAIADVFLSIFPTAFSEYETIYKPEHGVTVLTGYQAWATQNDQEWQIKAIEQVGEFHLALHYPFQVKPDLVILTPAGYFAEEFKTTQKALSEEYWRFYEMAGQLTAQAAYVEANYGQCSGVFVTAIRLGYRQRRYREESAGFHYQIQRQLFNRSSSQIANWKQRTMRTIDRLEAVKASGQWEQNTRQCFYCEFNQLCQAVGDINVQQVLYESYDPYAYLKSEQTKPMGVNHA